MSRILVVGAGYGGAMCAARLAGRGLDVTVVDPSPIFQHRVRFHDIAAGTADPDRPLADWLGVPHVQARAVGIRSGAVDLDDGRTLTADHIVVAIGRGFGGPSGCSGLASVDDARAIAVKAAAGVPLTVVGAGTTGIELAGALAAHTQVTLVDRADLSSFSPDVGRVLRRWFTEAGVVHQPHQDGVIDSVASPSTIWAGGTRAHRIPVEGATVLPDGRWLASPELVLAPGIFGVGDAVAVSHQPWHAGGCAIALPMGAHVADQLATGRTTPFDYRWSARLIAFGRRAVLQGTDPRGTPTRLLAAGRLAGVAKAGLISTVMGTIRLERRTGMRLFQWPRTPARLRSLPAPTP